MRRKYYKWLILVGSVLFFVWAFPVFYTKSSFNRSSWWTGRCPDPLSQLPDERVLPVSPSSRKKAIELLKDASFAQIKDSQVELFLGYFPQMNGLDPYIARGVALGSSGKFYASSNKHMVEVTCINYGRYPKFAKKWPVIVYLETEPERVYCTFSMVE